MDQTSNTEHIWIISIYVVSMVVVLTWQYFSIKAKKDKVFYYILSVSPFMSTIFTVLLVLYYVNKSLDKLSKDS